MGRRRGALVIVFWMALLLAGCGELTPPGERIERYGTYTVRPGDTLYSIAWRYGLDHYDVAAWNHIRPPYVINQGQVLVMSPPLRSWSDPPVSRPPTTSPRKSPHAPIRPPPAKKSSAPPPKAKSRQPATTKSVGVQKKTGTSSQRSLEKGASRPTSLTSTSWRWPTEGKVVAKFDPDTGKKGVDITGRSGQLIFSAAAGDVVYSGSGLLGYGKLVIIKHDDVYLSAYGHNSQLLVKEGDKVAAGQKIATMGISPKEGAILHFEIRKEGKPVDPSRYLPKKN